MEKLNFNNWQTTSENTLPNFIDTEYLYIDIENVNVSNWIRINNHNRIDTIIFNFYGGTTLVEQFNNIKKLLPLILMFNGINDISNIKIGKVILLPDLNSLIDNTYFIKHNEDTLPGLNPLYKNKSNSLKTNIDKSTIKGLEGIDIELKKINYDSKTGIITY